MTTRLRTTERLGSSSKQFEFEELVLYKICGNRLRTICIAEDEEKRTEEVDGCWTEIPQNTASTIQNAISRTPALEEPHCQTRFAELQ